MNLHEPQVKKEVLGAFICVREEAALAYQLLVVF